MFSDSLRLQVPFHLRMDDAGSKSPISGLCSCTVITLVTMVSLSLLLQCDLITLVTLNPRSQSALLAGKESSKCTSWSTFGQVSWAVLNTSTHSGFFGRTSVFFSVPGFSVPCTTNALSLLHKVNLHYVLEQVPLR